MLIEFTVENYRSLKEAQTLRMTAASSQELRSTNVMRSGAPATPDVLRSAVIYGANAAGKSNLLRAIGELKLLVMSSGTRVPNMSLPYTPFGRKGEAPTTFEIIFVEDNVRYQYGVSYNASRVHEEWLYAYPEGRSQRWFNRSTGDDGVAHWSFGSHLRGPKKLWQEATRDNALFLSTAAQLNAEQLLPIYAWFSDKMQAIEPFARVSHDYTTHVCATDPITRKRVREFMAAADLGISELRIDAGKWDVSNLADDMPEHFRDYFLENMDGQDYENAEFVHRLPDGSEFVLNLDDESGGTGKLYALAGPWIDVLENGYVLLIDELDTSLHPQMLRHMVGLFHDPSVNRTGAQLIFTTHDTSALNQKVFRRDQVWLMEKRRDLASVLFSLTEFSPRKDENLERGYLQGRFGATPMVGSLVGNDIFVDKT